METQQHHIISLTTDELARANHLFWPLCTLKALFHAADRARLLAVGHPLPASDSYTLYRGVAGRGAARRITGLSWTRSRERAEWFASRFALPDPAVYQALVPRKDVYAYTNERQEDEFIVILPKSVRPERLHRDGSRGACR